MRRDRSALRKLCPAVFALAAIMVLSTLNTARAAESELRIITEISPPAAFLDDNGELTGLAVEAVQAIQREIGNTEPIQVMPWARGYRELTSSSDVALFSTTRTEARENLFQWVGPLFTTRWIMYARKGSGLRITCLEDAKSLGRIGVYREDARAQYLKDLGFENLDIAAKQELNMRKLLRGRVDVIVYSNLGLRDFIMKSGTDPELIEPVFEIGAKDLYIAFSKDADPEIVRTWREACDRLEKRGDLKRIRDKWLQ